MRKILVTGASGQLGQELNVLQSPLNYTFYKRQDWPIEDYAKTDRILSKEQPALLINLAAYTKVDLAEEDQKNCFNINRDAAANLALKCLEYGTQFIHLSSDYVFHKSSGPPSKPDSPKNPEGVYAKSKSEAEDLILQYNPDSIIIRSSWIYSTFGHNFVKTMLRVSQTKNTIRVVNDQVGSPTYGSDLAHFLDHISQLFLQHQIWHQGIHHYSNHGQISWYDFALKIFELANIEIEVVPISSESLGAKAPRPNYSVLDCSQTETIFKIKIPYWQESLKICLKKLLENSAV
ncbi:MAG: dTDP-4-dehydrorhamnose reductase [Saprospiraceae bacterium]|nr:dTDP-4-dehydrorhamnose reductase [Saprospiraceae bacterium]